MTICKKKPVKKKKKEKKEKITIGKKKNQ